MRRMRPALSPRSRCRRADCAAILYSCRAARRPRAPAERAGFMQCDRRAAAAALAPGAPSPCGLPPGASSRRPARSARSPAEPCEILFAALPPARVPPPCSRPRRLAVRGRPLFGLAVLRRPPPPPARRTVRPLLGAAGRAAHAGRPSLRNLRGAHAAVLPAAPRARAPHPRRSRLRAFLPRRPPAALPHIPANLPPKCAGPGIVLVDSDGRLDGLGGLFVAAKAMQRPGAPLVRVGALWIQPDGVVERLEGPHHTAYNRNDGTARVPAQCKARPRDRQWVGCEGGGRGI